MASNNYFGFTHGGTQYSAPGSGAAYPNGQSGYAVAPAGAATTYAAQRGGCDPAYQAAGTYPRAASWSDYGSFRTLSQTYDASKTFYQQASSHNVYPTAAARPYNATRSKVGAYQTAQYVAGPTRNPVVAQAKPAAVNAVAAAVAASAYATAQVIQATAPQTTHSAADTVPKQQAAPGTANYTNYESALYSAAAMYVAEQTNKPIAGHGANYWPAGATAGASGAGGGGGANYKKQGGGHHGGKPRAKPQPKPQQLHYCEVCKISCAGPQTYREHLEGQKHKKRETSLKLAATAASATQNRGNNLHCELCDVTCTGNDAYAAHVRGSKHQKVVKLHQKLGKPIPAADQQSAKKVAKINFVQQTGTELSVPPKVDAKGAAGNGVATQPPSTAAVSAVPEAVEEDCIMEDVKPVGLEYIEEMKDDDGKTLSFNCKLCECKFNDPNAKEMHMKGRRHRLQYKKKVQPDLVVDFKPNPRQRRMAEAKAQRAVMQAEYWNQRLRDMSGQPGGENGEEDPMYWEERRRFEEEFDYIGGAWQRGGFPGVPRGAPHLRPPPFFGMLPGRRPESSDDRHVVARHAEIYPKEEELQTIQRIVSHTERALKFVSDALTDKPTSGEATGNGKATDAGDAVSTEKDAAKTKEDGRDNQMFSFQKEAEGGGVRILKGVMRVGLLAKGLLLQGDNLVQLVVLCADKPTHALMKRVAMELPVQLKHVSEDHLYTVSMAPKDGAVLVTDGAITVKVSLTSPLLRDSTQDATNATSEQSVHASEDLLPREPCLQALAALRHAKWFQARATGLQSCVMIMRIMRDLCVRTPTWTPLSQWAMELLSEKIISSAGIPLSPGDCMRRVMEGISTGIIINGPGILDPCEKEATDALSGLSKQQREDLTVSAQTFLRLIAFRQIHKVLGMDALPAPKFQQRQWRFARKRRRSGADGAEEADGKVQKKDATDAHKQDTSGK